jgi:hypothetical protein
LQTGLSRSLGLPTVTWVDSDLRLPISPSQPVGCLTIEASDAGRRGGEGPGALNRLARRTCPPWRGRACEGSGSLGGGRPLARRRRPPCRARVNGRSPKTRGWEIDGGDEIFEGTVRRAALGGLFTWRSSEPGWRARPVPAGFAADDRAEPTAPGWGREILGAAAGGPPRTKARRPRKEVSRKGLTRLCAAW